ncbi:MAG: hypothetical protein NTU59_00210, partial [Coprothermobacterota bacterium]|nr:hypothetical protein [Coprothermobacterota bacterium]
YGRRFHDGKHGFPTICGLAERTVDILCKTDFRIEQQGLVTDDRVGMMTRSNTAAILSCSAWKTVHYRADAEIHL